MSAGLDQLVGAARRRLIRQRLAERLAAALRPALVCGVLLLGADKLWRLRFEPWYPILALLAVAALAGLWAGWPRRLTAHRAALILDERLHSSERLSSALALRDAGYDGPLLAPLLADAEAHAAGLDLRTVLPIRWPTAARASLVLLALLLALPLVPRLSLWRSETDLATELVTRQVGEELVEKAESVQTKADQHGAREARRAADKLLREALKLRRARLDKAEALRRMETLRSELQQQRERLAGQPLERTARQARRDLRQAGELAQQVADQLEDPQRDAAQRLLEELANQVAAGKLTPDEARQAAESLQRAAEALQQTPYQQQAEQLAKAAEALADCERSGSSPSACDKAGDALRDAAEALTGGGGLTPDQELLDDLQEHLEQGKGAVGDAEGIKRESDRRGGQCPDGLCEPNDGPLGPAGRSRGPGSTNQEASPSPAEGAPQSPYQEGDSPPDTGPPSEYERLYAPRRTETLQHDEKATAKPQQGGQYASGEGPRDAPMLDDSKVPYYEVLGEYEAAADDAITKGTIPLTERARVKSYFDHLQQPAGD